MITDFETLLTDLEQYIASKPSHGQRDLLLKIAELRQAHRVPEGLLDRAFRLFGVRITQEPFVSIQADSEPTDDFPAGADAMAQDGDHRSIQDGGSHEQHHRGRARTAA